jgi:hypothetical protein
LVLRASTTDDVNADLIGGFRRINGRPPVPASMNSCRGAGQGPTIPSLIVKPTRREPRHSLPGVAASVHNQVAGGHPQSRVGDMVGSYKFKALALSKAERLTAETPTPRFDVIRLAEQPAIEVSVLLRIPLILITDSGDPDHAVHYA